MVLALFGGLLVPVLAARRPRGEAPAQRLAQRIDQRAAAVVLYVIFQRGRVVVDMHIGVYHREIKPRFDGGGAR
ncbi:hypothetical protein D3C78_1772620 [compost metagenome]